MPKQKDLKRRVRARMQKTGESYTTARSHLLRKRSTPSRADEPPALPDNYQELAGKSDETLAAKTGRTWPQWVEVLDGIGAMQMTHRDIARRVRDEIGDGWWSQTVTVGYERIRGLREVGQRRGGAYEAGKSRTLAAPIADVFDAFVNEKRRRQWLDVDLTVRKTNPHKTVRITWNDGTDVQVYFVEKGPSKTTVTIQHAKLPTRAAVDDAKAFWSDRLSALAALLT